MCNNNCNQGRDCTCDLQITMEDRAFTFEEVMRYIATLLQGIGIVGLFFIIYFLWSTYAS
jgi:hypothetical protein